MPATKIEYEKVRIMTLTITRPVGYLFSIVAILISLLTSSNLFPQVSQYSSQTLNTKRPSNLNIHDDSLLVRGVYWELPLAGVRTLVLDSNKLKVTGDSILSSGIVGLCDITRTVPSELTATKLVKDTSGVWFESDAISCYEKKFTECYRIFHKFSTGESFCYEEPFQSYYQILHVYLGKGDTAVIIFAFGKMNQDPKKWMGYILITK